MRTLRELVIKNVGADVATPEYFRSLGYDDDSLDTEAPIVLAGEVEIYEVPGGYHVSTDMEEIYSEDPVEDGYITAEEWNACGKI